MEDDSRTLEACRANYLEAYAGVARRVPGGVVEPHGSWTVVRTGIPAAPFNTVIALEGDGPVEETAAAVRRLLVDGGAPWSMMTTSRASPAAAALVERLGVVRALALPVMVLDLASIQDPPPCPALEVRQPRTVEELTGFARTLSEGYGAPADLLQPWYGAFAARSGEIAPYLGYVEGRAVGTAVRVTSGTVAGVYHVSTVPAFRHRGFGTALTWRAAADGRREGCTFSCLQASEQGLPVYAKMGYRIVEEYLVWLPASPGTGRGG